MPAKHIPQAVSKTQPQPLCACGKVLFIHVCGVFFGRFSAEPLQEKPCKPAQMFLQMTMPA
ncbi:MAG TPA: hypothetical protein PKW71_04150 [Anaerohalosphaeraceae bacterium]|nr:hypothetical protein [Anaerohalosphaeraceae bacterium]HRV19824.1 hypothetical protein [Anaerohalosphaeraceae bacterium]